ncbi:MAG: CapA family protein [Oscillospiraceae bacterium]|nr:CapA family protein [Oscillospiraceae bacterium]
MKPNLWKLSAVACCLALTACGSAQKHIEVSAPVTTERIQPTTEATETPTEPTTEPEIPFDYMFCFTGDISVADGARTTNRWVAHGRDTSSCFDETIMEHMQKADICFADNEFPYTTRGSATVGKDYTYRADPANVQLMLDLGVDIVSIANNHTYDYGPDGVLDTLETLDNAGIARVGAGKNLAEASETKFFDLDGLRVAFLSGTRVEWVELTKGATETEPGVFRTVDPELLYQRVREARERADVVIVYIHWGIEGVDYLEEYQQTVGKGLVDAGADAVVGDHTHCLQGIEFYKDKPIIYSLGNFWFNAKTQRSVLAEIHVTGTRSDHELRLQYLPAMQSDCTISYISDPGQQSQYYRYLESISDGIQFDEDGYVTPKE